MFSRFSLAVLVAMLLASAAHAQDPKPARPDAPALIGKLRKIVTPMGIERSEVLRIGGIDQFVSIRGTDRRNPVLLILHGGPGFVELPLAWWNTRLLEEYFTVVHWDQRGAGKTYLLNDPKVVAPTMKPERFVADTEELVGWLRKDLGKDKIFLMGHSWGSVIGLQFAQAKPEWLHAYIGTGQAANSPDSERRGWAHALDAAKKSGNTKAVADLESIAPYAAPGRDIPLKDIVLERKWSDHFGGVMAFRPGQSDGEAAALSPDYSDADIARVYDGNGYSEKFLFADVLKLDFTHIRELKCPVLLLEGRHDKTVNSDVAHEWFQALKAPEKHFTWFENSAHEVAFEEPGKMLVTLVHDALPIARRAGDGPPQE